MEESEESLYKHFSLMETVALIDLQYSGELSNVAINVLEKVFSERGISSAERIEMMDLINENKAKIDSIATIWSRILAQLIDSIFAFMILVIPVAIFSYVSEVGVWVGVVAYLLYLLFQDGLFNGQSVGKRFTNIAVVNKYSGTACSFGASFVRNIFLVFFGVIDLLFLVSQYRQRLGDMMANTIVIDVK